MNNQQGSEDIERFCHDFLKERKRHLHNVIDNYRHLFMQIDIQQLNLTQETFDSSFKRISRKLFDTRPADRNYIISLFDSLTDILTGVGFQPKELIDEPAYCIML